MHGLRPCGLHCSWSDHGCLTSHLDSLDLLHIGILLQYETSLCALGVLLRPLVKFVESVEIWASLSHRGHRSLHLLLLKLLHQDIGLVQGRILALDDILVSLQPSVWSITAVLVLREGVTVVVNIKLVTSVRSLIWAIHILKFEEVLWVLGTTILRWAESAASSTESDSSLTDHHLVADSCWC